MRDSQSLLQLRSHCTDASEKRITQSDQNDEVVPAAGSVLKELSSKKIYVTPKEPAQFFISEIMVILNKTVDNFANF